jgi:patatin-like phospholipase/acyl hydrolase
MPFILVVYVIAQVEKGSTLLHIVFSLVSVVVDDKKKKNERMNTKTYPAFEVLYCTLQILQICSAVTVCALPHFCATS